MYDWFPSGSYEIYWRWPWRGESNQEPFCRGANCPSTQGGTVANPVAHRLCGNFVYLDSGSASLDHCNGQEYTGDDSESSHEGIDLDPKLSEKGNKLTVRTQELAKIANTVQVVVSDAKLVVQQEEVIKVTVVRRVNRLTRIWASRSRFETWRIKRIL